MLRFEYVMMNNTFLTNAPDYPTAKMTWFNSLGAQGWKIIETESAFDTRYGSVDVYVLVCREISDAL